MLDKLQLNNFHSGFEPSYDNQNPPFILRTCQRTVVLNYDYNNDNLTDQCAKKLIQSLEGDRAYHFLLEIICGLQSKLVGENEIVGQFKVAYQEYVSQEYRNSKIMLILEKLFKDAKEIRTNYLLGISQKTYSSIARKHIKSVHNAPQVLIVGSGQLAEDLINQFKKKIKVSITARNSEKVQELAQTHGIEIVPWSKLKNLTNHPFIANTIGCSQTLYDQEFFEAWANNHDKRLFVDLGSPSSVRSDFNYEQGLMKLDDIFKEGAVHEQYKKQKIQDAQHAMEGIVKKRYEIFRKKELNSSKYGGQSEKQNL